MLLDVPLEVNVELGPHPMTIQDLLQLGPGFVVGWTKVAGEALDILVNGRLVARGEAVVVNDKFGIRITDVVSPRSAFSACGRRKPRDSPRARAAFATTSLRRRAGPCPERLGFASGHERFSSLSTMAGPIFVLLALAATAFLLARRRRLMPRRVEILETTSLGPKRALVLARLNGEILLLGSSEAGIALLRSQPSTPAATLTMFPEDAPKAARAPSPSLADLAARLVPARLRRTPESGVARVRGAPHESRPRTKSCAASSRRVQREDA